MAGAAWRDLLRFRVIRWPFYRLVSVRNHARASARWTRNLLLWLIRASYYRGLFARNWLVFLGRWSGNHVTWLVRLVANRVRVITTTLGNVTRVSSRVVGSRTATLMRTNAPVAAVATVSRPPRRLPEVQVPTPTIDAMVVVHAHFVEALPPILDRVMALRAATHAQLPLLITVTAERFDAVRELVQAARMEAELIPVENRGRDILPFLTLAREGRLAHARVILKLHTKRSPHRADGEAWRDALVNGLTDPDTFHAVLVRAKSGSEFVAVPRHYIFGPRDWGRNVRLTGDLCAQLGIARLPFRFTFAAGTMFWISSGLVARFAQVPVQVSDFEPEPLPLDGALPHALERVIGVLAGAAGDGVLATETL